MSKMSRVSSSDIAHGLIMKREKVTSKNMS